MILPSRPLLQLLALWLAGGVAASVWPEWFGTWRVGGIALGVVALADLLVLAQAPRVTVERIVAGSLPLGVWREVRLRISNLGALRLSCDVFDHHPVECAAAGLPQSVGVAPGQWVQIGYRVRALARGNLDFGPVALRVASPLRLWQRRIRAGQAQPLRVFPNFAALTKYALLATDNRLSQIGVLQRRRRGEGMDFEQLREYREGDSLRKIDWKASQRVQKLISREYQEERDQQIVFLIDCGRRMRAKDGESSHFDHALDATLLLAYVSLRQGDAVGMMTMAGEQRYLAPHKSAATVTRILHLVYDLQPTLLTTDFYSAAVALGQRLRKRAMVVLVSNLRDEDDDTLEPALGLLQRRHLVLFASLRERALDDVLSRPVSGFDDALTYAAAIDYRQRRDAVFRRLRHGNVVCLDVPPSQLALALVNQYLEVKRSGRL